MTLLQTDLLAGAAIVYIAIAIFTLLIYCALARWIFRIDTNTKFNKMQVDLLVGIALKSGMPLEDVYKAIGRKMPKGEVEKGILYITSSGTRGEINLSHHKKAIQNFFVNFKSIQSWQTQE